MGSLAAVYSPALFVTSSRVKPLSVLETVIFAPGITPPKLSVTVPTIVAASWAQTEVQTPKKSTDSANKRPAFMATSGALHDSATDIQKFSIIQALASNTPSY